MTITNDHDFSVVKSSVLKKKKDACVVNVEFDVDTMNGFRIQKRVWYCYSCGADADSEL